MQHGGFLIISLTFNLFISVRQWVHNHGDCFTVLAGQEHFLPGFLVAEPFLPDEIIKGLW